MYWMRWLVAQRRLLVFAWRPPSPSSGAAPNALANPCLPSSPAWPRVERAPCLPRGSRQRDRHYGPRCTCRYRAPPCAGRGTRQDVPASIGRFCLFVGNSDLSARIGHCHDHGQYELSSSSLYRTGVSFCRTRSSRSSFAPVSWERRSWCSTPSSKAAATAVAGMNSEVRLIVRRAYGFHSADRSRARHARRQTGHPCSYPTNNTDLLKWQQR